MKKFINFSIEVFLMFLAVVRGWQAVFAAGGDGTITLETKYEDCLEGI